MNVNSSSTLDTGEEVAQAEMPLKDIREGDLRPERPVAILIDDEYEAIDPLAALLRLSGTDVLWTGEFRPEKEGQQVRDMNALVDLIQVDLLLPEDRELDARDVIAIHDSVPGSRLGVLSQIGANRASDNHFVQALKRRLDYLLDKHEAPAFTALPFALRSIRLSELKRIKTGLTKRDSNRANIGFSRLESGIVRHDSAIPADILTQYADLAAARRRADGKRTLGLAQTLIDYESAAAEMLSRRLVSQHEMAHGTMRMPGVTISPPDLCGSIVVAINRKTEIDKEVLLSVEYNPPHSAQEPPQFEDGTIVVSSSSFRVKGAPIRHFNCRRPHAFRFKVIPFEPGVRQVEVDTLIENVWVGSAIVSAFVHDVQTYERRIA